MNWLDELVRFTGGTAVAVAAAWWLVRTLIKHRLAKELKDYKTDLSKSIATYKAELSQRAEVLKTDLSIYAHEQNVGLSRIDAQRSDAIRSIWNAALKWQNAYERIGQLDRLCNGDYPPTNPGQIVTEYESEANQLVDLSRGLKKVMEECAIYFDQHVYSTILSCASLIFFVSQEFYDCSFKWAKFETPEDRAAHLPRVYEASSQLSREVDESVSKLREELISEFRRLMKADPRGNSGATGGTHLGTHFGE